jgi:hypothetical protein
VCAKCSSMGFLLSGLRMLDPPLSSDWEGGGANQFSRHFRQFKHFLFLQKKTKKLEPLWGRSPNFVKPRFYFFVTLIPMQNFGTLRLPLLEKSKCRRKRRERERKNIVNSGHLVGWQRKQGAQPNIMFRTYCVMCKLHVCKYSPNIWDKINTI